MVLKIWESPIMLLPISHKFPHSLPMALFETVQNNFGKGYEHAQWVVWEN